MPSVVTFATVASVTIGICFLIILVSIILRRRRIGRNSRELYGGRAAMTVQMQQVQGGVFYNTNTRRNQAMIPATVPGAMAYPATNTAVAIPVAAPVAMATPAMASAVPVKAEAEAYNPINPTAPQYHQTSSHVSQL